MVQCVHHGGPINPCKKCIEEAIPRLEKENEIRKSLGIKTLHDVDSLRAKL